MIFLQDCHECLEIELLAWTKIEFLIGQKSTCKQQEVSWKEIVGSIYGPGLTLVCNILKPLYSWATTSYYIAPFGKLYSLMMGLFVCGRV